MQIFAYILIILGIVTLPLTIKNKEVFYIGLSPLFIIWGVSIYFTIKYSVEPIAIFVNILWIGILFLFISVTSIIRHKLCSIGIKAKIVDYDILIRKRVTSVFPICAYQYNGKSYKQKASQGFDEIEIRKYPKGKEILIFVMPNKPYIFIIDKHIQYNITSFLCLGIIFIVCAIILLITSI